MHNLDQAVAFVGAYLAVFTAGASLAGAAGFKAAKASADGFKALKASRTLTTSATKPGLTSRGAQALVDFTSSSKFKTFSTVADALDNEANYRTVTGDASFHPMTQFMAGEGALGQLVNADSQYNQFTIHAFLSDADCKQKQDCINIANKVTAKYPLNTLAGQQINDMYVKTQLLQTASAVDDTVARVALAMADPTGVVGIINTYQMIDDCLSPTYDPPDSANVEDGWIPKFKIRYAYKFGNLCWPQEEWTGGGCEYVNHDWHLRNKDLCLTAQAGGDMVYDICSNTAVNQMFMIFDPKTGEPSNGYGSWSDAAVLQVAGTNNCVYYHHNNYQGTSGLGHKPCNPGDILFHFHFTGWHLMAAAVHAEPGCPGRCFIGTKRHHDYVYEQYYRHNRRPTANGWKRPHYETADQYKMWPEPIDHYDETSTDCMGVLTREDSWPRGRRFAMGSLDVSSEYFTHARIDGPRSSCYLSITFSDNTRQMLQFTDGKTSMPNGGKYVTHVTVSQYTCNGGPARPPSYYGSCPNYYNCHYKWDCSCLSYCSYDTSCCISTHRHHPHHPHNPHGHNPHGHRPGKARAFEQEAFATALSMSPIGVDLEDEDIKKLSHGEFASCAAVRTAGYCKGAHQEYAQKACAATCAIVHAQRMQHKHTPTLHRRNATE